ncbi:MAG: dihydrolipoamide acetyltransferase family protein [Planctomycetota bacterium]
MAHAKSTDPNVFILPDLGEGVHEAELISWKVKPGETVEEHQVVAEMETDKALVEVPSPRDGVIKELFGNVGDILNVGEPAWTYEGATTSAPEPKPAPASKPAPAPEPSSNGASSNGEREDAGTVVGTMSGGLGGVSAEGGKALATPAVRRLARDLGVEIDTVAGSGIAGRVTERDVRAAADSGGSRPAPAPAPAVQPSPPAEAPPAPSKSLATTVARENVAAGSPVPIDRNNGSIVPFRGVRRTIANRLRQSIDTAVHFSVMDDADVTKLDAERKKLEAASGEKVSYLPFVVSALCRAVKKHPALNALADDASEEIIVKNVVHMGIAADTEHGLTVPVIPDADAMGVLQIAREISDLARATRDRTIPRERLMGSTITISNVGSYAGKYATPVINYPEVAILAAGRVFEGVVADNGAIKVSKLLPLSMTCDHRCVDGAEAARCLATVVDLLKNHPDQLLTPARG